MGGLSRVRLWPRPAPCGSFVLECVGTNDEFPCLMYQRYCNLGLGVPFHFASFSLPTLVLVQVCGFKLGGFVCTFGSTLG